MLKGFSADLDTRYLGKYLINYYIDTSSVTHPVMFNSEQNMSGKLFQDHYLIKNRSC